MICLVEFSASLKSAKEAGLGLSLGKRLRAPHRLFDFDSVTLHFGSVVEADRKSHLKTLTTGLRDLGVVVKPSADGTRLVARANAQSKAPGGMSGYCVLVREVQALRQSGVHRVQPPEWRAPHQY